MAVGNGCLQFWIALSSVCGASLSNLIYTTVGELDVTLQGDSDDDSARSSLLRGLRASHFFWAGLCFFGACVISERRKRNLSSQYLVHCALLLVQVTPAALVCVLFLTDTRQDNCSSAPSLVTEDEQPEPQPQESVGNSANSS